MNPPFFTLPRPAGRPPKNVDYIGLDLTREHLLFYASSPEALRDLKVGDCLWEHLNIG